MKDFDDTHVLGHRLGTLQLKQAYVTITVDGNYGKISISISNSANMQLKKSHTYSKYTVPNT